MAWLKQKNICNKSTSKMQYTFSKEQRFVNRGEHAKTLLDKYYDIPQQLSKKTFTFSKDKKLRYQLNQVPSPGHYSLKETTSAKDITFKAGREVRDKFIKQCKAGSMFGDPKRSDPGPQTYSPVKPKSKASITISGKLLRSYSNFVPGPKYSFQSTLDDRNKVLSQNKRRGCIRLVTPTEKRRAVSY